MAKKHLRELLREEQEPFFLVDYINERRTQLQKTELGLRLCRKKMASSVSPARSEVIRRRSSSCFFAKRSPLFEFSERSPCRESASLAAGFLLNTALKIHEEAKDARSRKKICYFGSILRTLVMRKRSRKRDSHKNLLRWELFEKETNMVDGVVAEKGVSEVRFSCSCNSSVWTESVEEKSMDLESSCCESEEFEGMEFIKERRKDRFPFKDAVEFCSSPFRFSVTPRSLDSVLRTPDFSSPRRSSSHSRSEVMDNSNINKKFNGENEKDDKEKEHFSPVSVLDHPFEDDYERREEEIEENEALRENFLTVQRTKQALLEKIRRFEMLAQLEPIELEKLLNEEDENVTNANSMTDDEDELYEKNMSSMLDEQGVLEDLIHDILIGSKICNYHQKIPRDMKMLVLDMMEEEKVVSENAAELADKLCKRLESWKEVELNTVDRMVELDYIRDRDDWKNAKLEVDMVGVDTEHALLDLLLNELSAELIPLNCPPGKKKYYQAMTFGCTNFGAIC